MTTIPTKSEIGMEELLESLTGYEEQEIEKRFGLMPDALLAAKMTMGARALVAVTLHRIFDAEGIKDPGGRAFKTAMGMKFSDVMAFFPDDEPGEVDPEHPVTESGKDDSDGAQ